MEVEGQVSLSSLDWVSKDTYFRKRYQEFVENIPGGYFVYTADENAVEMNKLEGKLDNVNNYCIAVKENGDDIVFLRKIIPGGADKSYGIQVAKLAGGSGGGKPDSAMAGAKDVAALPEAVKKATEIVSSMLK